MFGIAVCLLATACFSLGIADVVYTYSTYCAGRSTPACDSVPVHLTWVAVGIWASIPVRCHFVTKIQYKFFFFIIFFFFFFFFNQSINQSINHS